MPSKDPPQNQADSADLEQVMQQCNRLAQRRQYRQALTLCRRHLANRPDSPDLLNLAGTLAFHDGQLREAEAFFRHVIRLGPRQPLVHVNLARTLKRSGNIDGAVAAYQTALGLAPNNPQILAELGALYAGNGDVLAAAQTFERLLNLNPDHPAALDYLEPFYRNVLANSPDHAVAHKNLAVVLMQRGRLDEATTCYARAHELMPNDVEIMAGLAHAYYLLGEPSQAEPVYRRAIERAPERAALHYGLGITLNSLGKTAEAIDRIRKAIRLDPTLAHAHRKLAYIKKHERCDDDVRLMEQVLERPGLDTTQRIQLNFGLGKAYEDMREYDRAFEYYAAANNLKRGASNYDIGNDQRLFEAIEEVFNEALLSRFNHCGHSDNRPVFIVGMPRSGTTLVEQILAAHPDVYGAGELKHLGQSLSGYFADHFNSRFPIGIDNMDCRDFEDLGRRYCTAVSRYNAETRFITDKMPHNFVYVGMIHLMLPEAKIIHCMRDPLDTCFSCYANGFREGQDYTYRLDELGKFYGLYHKLMQHWRGLPGIDLIDVSYEALINDQEAQTRRLLDACGLEWNDACLDFHKSDRPVMTASVNQVRSGIYNRSVRRWRHFESHLTPLIDTLKEALPALKNEV